MVQRLFNGLLLFSRILPRQINVQAPQLGVDIMEIIKRTRVKEVPLFKGQKIKIEGFVHELRSQSKVKFLLIRESSGIIQTVALPEIGKLFSEIEKIPKESVVAIVGIVKEEKQAPGGFEIQIESFEVLSEASRELPIQVIEKGSEEISPTLRMDYRWIELRKPKQALIFKIATTMETSMREYWESKEYVQIHSPKLIGTPSEGGAEVFSLEYFGKKAYLAQSPQFYKQMAMACGFEKVFEIGPAFRSDPSHTTRHAPEFTSIDMEISYVHSLEEIIQEEEQLLTHVLSKIKEKHGEEIKKHFKTEVIVPKTPFPRIPMSEASKLLKEKGITEEKDLSPEGERILYEIVKEKFGHEFVFVTEYPISVRPFYHMRIKEKPEITESFDLIWKGLEITTGSLREHRYEILKRQAIEKGISLEPIFDYLSFFKYGCPPHAGLGIGHARLLMQLLGLKSIRESTFVPRTPERLTP